MLQLAIDAHHSMVRFISGRIRSGLTRKSISCRFLFLGVICNRSVSVNIILGSEQKVAYLMIYSIRNLGIMIVYVSYHEI
jgi:hypothetical protein